MFRKLIRILKDKRGVATSLLEATATIAVGATLAGAAVTVVTDKIQDARIAQGFQDVQSLADAINTFEKDNLFFPIFESSGNSSASASTSSPNPFTSPSSSSRAGIEVEILTSASGDYPERQGNGDVAATHTSLTGGTHQTKWLNAAPAGGTDDHVDTLEGQLNENSPKYTVKGAITFDTERGYAGPYLSSLSSTDPWGNRYESNVHFLNDKDLTNADGLVDSFQTITISAGPNEQIQTSFQAQADASGKITVKGDDIAFRVR